MFVSDKKNEVVSKINWVLYVSCPVRNTSKEAINLSNSFLNNWVEEVKEWPHNRDKKFEWDFESIKNLRFDKV